VTARQIVARLLIAEGARLAEETAAGERLALAKRQHLEAIGGL
jgi:hypothetical protein